MNILIAATELWPYVSASPAAESISSLAKALRLLGHDLTLVSPRFGGFEAAGLMAGRRLSPLELAGGAIAHVYDVSLPSGARLVLVDAPDIDVEKLSERTAEGAQALGRFSDAVAALVLEARDAAPFDIVHAHDAAAGLALLKLRLAGADDVGKLLTIHDGDQQGTYPAELQAALGIPDSWATQQSFRSGDELCLLKGALGLADTTLAPSEAYAEALQAVERFGSVARALRARAPVGVLGGVDHAVYNPATDSALHCRYDAQDPSNKGRCRSAWLKELRLPIETARPLVLFEDVAPGDGALETLLGAAAALARLDLTLVLVSPVTPTEAQKAALEALSGQLLLLPSLDARARRRALSAADFYLSCELHVPSGHRLMQASRYGAVPVALARDAARDLVIDADVAMKSGTGLSFDTLDQQGLLGVLGRAVAAFRKAEFRALLSRVMRQDVAWDRPARRHLQLYRQASGSPR